MRFSRRELPGVIGAAIGISALRADPLGFPVGCQLYPVAKALGQDFDGTVRRLAAIGYRSVEMCSPMSYREGFGTVAGVKPADLRQRLNDDGVRCPSCHFGFRELKENLDERIAWAKDFGLSQMILSSFGMRRDATMDDWMRSAEELNKIAEKVHGAGLECGYHNHNFEFQRIGDALIYDKLLERFDPKLVKLQFQVSVISLGYHAATYMEKNPGRFLSLHLQDWSSAEKKTVPIGKGDVDWKKLFTAAKRAGVKNYFVEMDLELMAASYPYLHSLS